MKRFLLFVMMCVCVSIGAWAGPREGYDLKTEDIGRWFVNGNASVPEEKVIYLEITKAMGLKGHGANEVNAPSLAAALEEISTILSGTNLEGHQNQYYSGLGATNIANKRLILKVVYHPANGEPATLSLSSEDLAALNTIDIPTIDLQDLMPASAFVMANPNVKNLILPDGWTKTEVTDAAQGCSNLNAAFSMGVTSEYQLNDNGAISNGATVTAYVRTPGTLFESTRRSGYVNHSNTKLGTIDPYTWSLKKTTVATFTGNPSARDYSSGDVVCDENGHFVFDKEADENAANGEGGIYNAAVGGGTRNLVGTSKSGALTQAPLVVLDLGDAIIEEAHCSDLTFPMVGSLGAQTEKVVLPTYSGLKTIPADCMNFSSKVRDICIPGNIEYIKTRAFNSSGANSRLAYVWTTGTDPTVKYDNGACFTDGADNICHDEAGYVPNACLYGTFTLPPNLKLIERFAFANSINVKDVFVLNTTAPECHVDAFSTDMYVGNNTYDASAIVDGIITRDAYIQGTPANHRFIAMLHYPRETETPNVQRYTDPTREYSVATGERDGYGNTIYFPNQSEFSYAYLQGSYGYVWKAWNDARNWYDNELTLGYGNGFALDKASHSSALPNAQQNANNLWRNNPSTILDDGHLEKWDRSFYDLTTGPNNTFDEVAAPNGDLRPYYEVERRGIKLYPKADLSTVTDGNGNIVYKTVELFDEYGEPLYVDAPVGSTYEGNFARYEHDFYDEADNGEYCHRLVQDQNGEYIIHYEYEKNNDGVWCKAPYDGVTWINYDASWMGNIQRYDRVVTGLDYWDGDYNKTRYNLSDDYVNYASYSTSPAENKNALKRYSIRHGYAYRPATAEDSAPFYVRATTQVPEEKIENYNDYRGWHQFVLVATAHNSTEEFEPLRSFITDNDWWTICEPYDLRYSDMVKFFGYDRLGMEKRIPYLSKLMYVVRDVEKQKITLMFSKNLMEYMEYEVIGGEKKSINEGTHVHGWIDDQTKWPEQKDGKYLGEEGYDPIILHAGVPYLIKPNLFVDAQTGNIDATRQFDVYKTENGDLYARLHAAQEMPGSQQKQLIYNGIYTVPTYVVGLGENQVVSENTISNGTSTIEMRDGSSFTYKNSANASDSDVKPVYGGNVLTNYEISDDFDYTFVGSFYKSVMPQFCYFLGWDSKNNCAAFWYSAVQDKSGWNWNNETGVICPNFNKNLTIHSATSLKDPARWIINAGSDIKSDDFPTAGGSGSAKIYSMEMGAANFFEVDVEIDGVATGINKMNEESSDIKVYSADGIYIGSSLRGLAKGLYIVNGKKYVVK